MVDNDKLDSFLQAPGLADTERAELITNWLSKPEVSIYSGRFEVTYVIINRCVEPVWYY